MNIIRKVYSLLLELVETFVFFGAIFLLIYAFLFRPFQVNGDSMKTNFLNGEYILTSLISIKAAPIKRGEVIVFTAPPNVERDYIKRVIGLPGEKVTISNGKIYINDKLLHEETYLSPLIDTNGQNFLREGQSVIVPDNNYFVMGDNRNVSSDSRDWGFVPKEKIIGKSVLVYWPPSKFRLIADEKY